jgi:uncharacterized protein YlxW (UPF0749 family)
MRSQEDIQLIKAMQFSIERLQVDFDAVVERSDIARADLEKVVGYNTKLQKERDKAHAEVEQLKQALHDARLENSGQAAQLERKRPEPSRLEIAATLVASRFSSTLYVTEVKGTWIKYALEGADALIAAAKEGK